MSASRPVRPVAVAGTFYPAERDRLTAALESYLAEPHGRASDPGGGPSESAAVGGGRRVPALIAPHAGWVYSGVVAGTVLRAAAIPATCIILAPNHTGSGRTAGGSVLRSRDYATPLGTVPTDEPLADALMAAAGDSLADDPAAHAAEHGVEVLLPFLQRREPSVRIVAIVLGWTGWAETAALARAIRGAIGQRTDVLVIASTDMNHYEPAADTERKDRLALDRIEALDGEGLLAVTDAERISMCGRVPAACACEVARLGGGRRGATVAYAHSGLVNNDYDRVVGYAGVLLGVG